MLISWFKPFIYLFTSNFLLPTLPPPASPRESSLAILQPRLLFRATLSSITCKNTSKATSIILINHLLRSRRKEISGNGMDGRQGWEWSNEVEWFVHFLKNELTSCFSFLSWDYCQCQRGVYGSSGGVNTSGRRLKGTIHLHLRNIISSRLVPNLTSTLRAWLFNTSYNKWKQKSAWPSPRIKTVPTYKICLTSRLKVATSNTGVAIASSNVHATPPANFSTW